MILVTSNAVFDNIFIFNVTGTGFSANDAGIEYVNITLRNSEITNTNAMSKTNFHKGFFKIVFQFFFSQVLQQVNVFILVV